MDIKKIKKIIVERFYYLPLLVMPTLTIIYCSLVYFAGEIGNSNSGYKNLIGIPNYYFFYLIIFPILSSGILFIATRNINTRFFGEINSKLDKHSTRKILFYRKPLFFIAIALSFQVTFTDAGEKGHTLPPFSLSLNSESHEQPASDHDYAAVTDKYFQLKDDLKEWLADKPDSKHTNETVTCWNENTSIADESSIASLTVNIPDFQKQYFDYLKMRNYGGSCITGFKTISSWFHNSSYIYKFESFLSWIAALIIAIFFAQLFLLFMIKKHIGPETKNLMIWLLILCSIWVPCKLFSVYYYSLIYRIPPGLVWFAIGLLLLVIFLVFFIRIENNDMSKFVSLVIGALSVGATIVSIFKPQYYEQAVDIIKELGWTYGSILLGLFAFSLYLVTEHLIHDYENNKLSVSSEKEK